MKYTLELTIQKPQSEVWKLFGNPENMKLWQPTLTGIEVLEGVQGKSGSISKLTYSERREFTLLEKVIHRDELKRFDTAYDNDFANNTVKNSFEPVNENETLWKMEVEYKFKTFLMKLAGPIMKRNFVARSKREMERFKEFAEQS
jgi:uncharacterized membrane protein